MVPIGSCLDNRYEIIAFIGHGNFSTVYKAIDKAENEPVALKLLNKSIPKNNLENIM